MALFKNDHSRRIDGDAILARKSAFKDLGDLVWTHWTMFSESHTALMVANDARGDALIILEAAREARDDLGDDLKRLYAWGYYNIRWPAFDDWRNGDLPGARVSAALFPGGNPSHACRTRQWTIDSAGRVVAAIDAGMAKDLPKSCLPPAFVADIRGSLEVFKEAILAVRLAEDVHNDAVADVMDARARWDRSHRLLVDITRFSLNTRSEIHRLSKLIPMTSSPRTAVEAEFEGEEVAEQEVLEVLETTAIPADLAPIVALTELPTIAVPMAEEEAA